MEENIIQLCTNGLLPKLPFLLEERDELTLKTFFNNPAEHYANVGAEEAKEFNGATAHSNTISVNERKTILDQLLTIAKDDKFVHWWQNLSSKSRVVIILFLSESSNGAMLWSSNDCSELVISFCHLLSVKLGNDSMLNGLASWFQKNHDESSLSNDTDLYRILQSVKLKFNKSDWKYFPASVHGFGWVLHQANDSALSNYIDLIIPPALLFSDDYYDDHKILGLKILSHVVNKSEKSHLIKNNWANVIYDAVQRHCTDKEPMVIELMISILMNVLEIIEKNPLQNNHEFTKYDHLLKKILFQMAFSSDLNLKHIWLRILDEYINTMGLACLHLHLKICDVLRDYTICNDFGIWTKILDVTATLIKNTWIKPDCEFITEIILRVVFNVSSFNAVNLSDEQKNEIFEKATNSLGLLHKCEGFMIVENQLQEIVEHGHTEQLHPNFIESLRHIFPAQQTTVINQVNQVC